MKKLAGAMLLILLFARCGKDNGAYIPNVPVNYNVTVVEFKIRSAETNGILLVPDQGVAGLMIVSTPTGYAAFDRCSSVNPQNLCKVTPDPTGITATDPCTGAKYLLTDGSPQKAPAVRYLKSYRTTVQGGTLINVSN